MDSEDHTHELPALKEYIEKLEPLRNISFKDAFPELAHLV
jgi:hypothetical protein